MKQVFRWNCRRLAGLVYLVAFLTLMSAFQTSPARAEIYLTFDGTYYFGVNDAWKQEPDASINPGHPNEISPGFGGAGKAQGLSILYPSSVSSYFVKTLPGLTAGRDYDVNLWIRTYRGDGLSTTPIGWVEFGWDPQARDTAQPNTNMIWCTDPTADYARNVGNWVKYTGEPFTATTTSVTIAFKVGSTDPRVIIAQFDELRVSEFVLPDGRYSFPDHFEGAYKVGAAYGWSKRFIAGGVNAHFAEAPGWTGSAQLLYAGTELPDKAVSIGVVKVFEVTPDHSYTVNVLMSASDSSGNFLSNADPDPGPVVKFGVDPTAQTADPDAPSLLWNNDATQYFSTPGQQNTWHEFASPMFRPTTDTVSVWLWIEGDKDIGVSAKFDDLTLNGIAGSGRWELYR
jgi:hypothetical protein